MRFDSLCVLSAPPAWLLPSLCAPVGLPSLRPRQSPTWLLLCTIFSLGIFFFFVRHYRVCSPHRAFLRLAVSSAFASSWTFPALYTLDLRKPVYHVPPPFPRNSRSPQARAWLLSFFCWFRAHWFLRTILRVVIPLTAQLRLGVLPRRTFSIGLAPPLRLFIPFFRFFYRTRTRPPVRLCSAFPPFCPLGAFALFFWPLVY